MLTWEYVEGNILRENIWLAEEEKNVEGKGGIYLEKISIWPAEEKRKRGDFLAKENLRSAEEKKNRVGRGGKYLEKENLGHRRKKEKIFEEG